MGLAASQARLLQLTSRQHTIEYQAQRLQAMKLQLANESDYAYTEYMNALDSKKIQYRFVDDDGSISYKNATFNTLFTYKKGSTNIQNQYALEIASGEDEGKFYVSSDVAAAFNKTANFAKTFVPEEHLDEIYQLACKMNSTLDPEGSYKDSPENCTKFMNDFNSYVKMYLADHFASNIAKTTASSDGKVAYNDPDEATYYENLYLMLSESKGFVVFEQDTKGDNYRLLTNMLESGVVRLHKWENGVDEFSGKHKGDYSDIGRVGAWANTSVSTDTLLQEVADEAKVKKAEAKYEAETTRINNKDAQYDTLLSQTETERNAIKTEMDSLKKVRDENIDKTFKMFG